VCVFVCVEREREKVYERSAHLFNCR